MSLVKSYEHFCKFQVELEEEAKKPPEEKSTSPEIVIGLKQQQSIAQIIYAENRVRTDENDTITSYYVLKVSP